MSNTATCAGLISYAQKMFKDGLSALPAPECLSYGLLDNSNNNIIWDITLFLLPNNAKISLSTEVGCQ